MIQFWTKMRVFGGGRVLPVLMLLLHVLILSQFRSGTTVVAGRLHVSEAELQRSMARYRQLLEHDDSRRDHLKSSEQEEKKESKTTGDDPNEAKDEQEKNNTVEKEQSKEEQQELVTEHHEGKEQQIAEEVKTEEKNHQEEPKVDKVEEAEKEGEPSVKTEKHQNQVEEQKETEGQKEQESESHPENQQKVEEQKGTERQNKEQESESNPENQQHGEEKQETEATSEDHPTEEKEAVESKIEENKSEERNDSESKTEEEKTDSNVSQSESKTEEEKPAEEEPFVFPEPYLLGPPIKDWDKQRRNWLKANPHMKTQPDGKPRVLIVSGSQPNPCRSPVGDYFHIKSLKLKIDYARMHNYEIYYSFAWLDPLFGSYWVKLPILRKLMLTHPEIEWFFWIDSDAVFTDMLFEAPFHTYEGINMIMWGYHQGFYVEKSWVAFNAGVFLIRNCQWSLDLFDKWSPMGPDGPVRNEYGKILTAFLSYRPEEYPADDQSALAYLILTDEAVNSKVKLVDLNDYMVSAWWVEVVDNYETSMEKYHPGLGDYRWPWITHFTGCGPCGGDGVSPDYLKCMKNIERAFNFADNQVLAYMGFQHESLSSETLLRIRNESDQPIELVGVNPWEERIVQLAAAAA